MRDLGAQYQWRGTFIDEVHAEPAMLRSRSAPELGSLPDFFGHDRAYADDLTQRVVHSIPSKKQEKSDAESTCASSSDCLDMEMCWDVASQEAREPREPEGPKITLGDVPSFQPEAPVPMASKLSPSMSVGSVGHPDLCLRPCMFFASGNCVNGIDCIYCHMHHENRHMDKQKRELLQSLSPIERNSLMLAMLRTRAVMKGLAADAAQLLDTVEELLGCPPARMVRKMDHQTAQTFRMMETSLLRSPFMLILKMALRPVLKALGPEGSQEVWAGVQQSLQSLRESAAQGPM